jgi:hypothetical protein
MACTKVHEERLDGVAGGAVGQYGEGGEGVLAAAVAGADGASGRHVELVVAGLHADASLAPSLALRTVIVTEYVGFKQLRRKIFK